MQARPFSHFLALAACAIDLSAASDLRILPAGTFRARDGRPKDAPAWHIDRALADRVIARVAARNTRCVVDYEHQTLNAEQNGQPAPAAGWFKALEWRDPAAHGDAGGLYATDMQWTARAKAMIDAGEYRYFSPVFAYDKTGAVMDVLMAAITNNPALDNIDELNRRAAARFSATEEEEHQTMNELLKKLLGTLGLAETTAEAEAIAAVAALKAKADQVPVLEEAVRIAAAKAITPDPAKYVPVDAMAALQTEVAALRSTETARAIDDLVQPALADGRLLPAQEKWARDLGASNIAALKTYIDTAKPIAALTRTQTGGKGPAGGDPSQPLDARCKAQFESTAALREEFPTLGAYTAYVRAKESGQVRVLTKGDQQ